MSDPHTEMRIRTLEQSLAEERVLHAECEDSNKALIAENARLRRELARANSTEGA